MRTKKTASGLTRASGVLGIVALVLMVQTTYAQTEVIETIRVDSNLVDLKVSVVGKTPQQLALLEQKDFQILEDGTPQEITLFATSDAPFDLVLLLDLSGSTEKKIDLIKRSAKRFVDATRERDRVAIVTFTDFVHLVSGFSLDRKELKRAIDKIERPASATKFWDSLRVVLEEVVSKQKGQRNAVVVMTDGVDNALPEVYGDGSLTPFPELLGIVQRSDVLIFPIYLDTEQEEVSRRRTPRSAFAIARLQLEQLAQASGTVLYRAARLKDLDEVYGQVIRDLSTVYSLGYIPTNTSADGRWRSVTVSLPGKQDLTARTRGGYYARTETGENNH